MHDSHSPQKIPHSAFRIPHFLLLLFLPACAEQPLHPKPNTSPFIEGRAKILEVHNPLGYALLDIDGKRLYAYWDTDPAHGQITTFNNTGPWEVATGNGKDLVVHHQDLPAKVGDTIVYRGMMTGPDLLLSGIAVISK